MPFTVRSPPITTPPVVVRVVSVAAPLRREASCEYFSEALFQARAPVPILNLPVSVSKPISPAARVGLVEVQFAAAVSYTHLTLPTKRIV